MQNRSESHLPHPSTGQDQSEPSRSQARSPESRFGWFRELKGRLIRKKSIQPSTPDATDSVYSTNIKKHTFPGDGINPSSPAPPSMVVNPATDQVPLNQDTFYNQPNDEAVGEALEAAVGVINDIVTPVRLASFLDKLSKFDSIVDNITSLHPYAQAAWSVLKLVPEAIINQATQDDSIRSLLSKMDDVYTFLIQEELQDIEFMKAVVERICQQTLECSYFIREYSQNKKFRMRLLKNFNSDTSERIKKYNEVFNELMEQFRNKAAGDTLVIVHRIWDNFEGLAQDMDLNSMPYVRGAGLDTQKLCLEGTRKETLDEITAWINNTEKNTSLVYWLNGNAGSGKSSIAHTIADRFKKLGRLGSCYCFDRNKLSQQRDKEIFTMIARDLSDRDEQMRKKLADAIHLDTSLKNTTDILQQWKELIMKPAMALSGSIVGPIVIVIDGLDESGGPESRRQLLRILAGKLGDDECRITKLPPHFRILLTSRPLPDIVNVFDGVEHVQSKSMDSISTLTTKRDIEHYISCQLSDLERVEIQQVSADFASASDGLFEWARLACAFIKNNDAGLTVQELLDAVMARNKDGPVQLLDGMYKLTLETIFPEGSFQRSTRLDRFRSVMAQIIKTAEPLPLTSLGSMRCHFADEELRKIDVNIIIKPLGALLSGITDPSAVVRPLHASFPEFLEDEKRSGEFFVSCSHIDKELACACLGVMEDELRFNMCKLPSSYLPNSKVPGLDECIEETISPALLYSCCFWARHIRNTEFSLALAEIVRAFFNREKLLFWLEAMSLLKKIGRCTSLLSDVVHWVMFHLDCKDIADNAADVQRFIRVFGGPISFSTPHLYVSAIPLSPQNSHISKTFVGRFSKVLKIARGHNETWPVIQGVLHGHYDEVNSVVSSPDGKWIASGSSDNTIRLWDAETGQLVRSPLRGHKDCVSSVAFSPDGKCIVSGSDDKTIRLWDVETGELVRPPLEGHEDWVNSVAFSPDGERILSGSSDKTIRLWNAETGQLVQSPLEGHEDCVSSVAFSPDGKRIVSGSDDKTIRLWDAATGELVRPPLEGHRDCINSVAFSPDGRCIVSGSDDKTIRLWDVGLGELTQPPLEGHEHCVNSVAFSPDGKCIVSGSDDKTIQLWDIETGELVRPPLEGHEDCVNCVAFSPDGKRIMSGSEDNTIHLWDAEMGELVRPLEGHEDWVNSVAFSPDGKWIVSGSFDKTIRLWDAETGELIRPPFEGHEHCVNSVAFSSDGKYIVSGSFDNTIRLWDVATGELVRPPLEGHENCVHSVAFSPDGKHIVSGSFDKTIRLWDAETGELVRPPLEGHEDWVDPVAFSPDGKHIVSGSGDNTIRLWAVETGELVRPPFEGHEHCITSVTFSPDGKWIMSGSFDKTIRLWDAETGELIRPPLEGHEDCINSVAFSPDGKHIVSGSGDKTIRLWDAQMGQLFRCPLKGHEDWVRSVAFSPDGKCIVSGSGDKMIRLWDVTTGGPVQPHSRGKYVIKFSQQLEHALTVPTEPADPAFSPSFYQYRDSGKALDQGWVHIGSTSNLLFWTPPVLHPQQYYPGLLMIIPEPDQLDLSQMVHGHSWYLCYQTDNGFIG